MIELAFTILFFISIFAIIKSARGDRSEERENSRQSRLNRFSDFIEKLCGSEGPPPPLY